MCPPPQMGWWKDHTIFRRPQPCQWPAVGNEQVSCFSYLYEEGAAVQDFRVFSISTILYIEGGRKRGWRKRRKGGTKIGIVAFSCVMAL